MNNITDFLEFFNIEGLTTMDANTTVYEFLGNITVGFISVIFTVIMVRVILEIIKIITDYNRFR